MLHGCYMLHEQNNFLMSSFIKSPSSYCPLIWILCSGTSMTKLSNIHEKWLLFITKDYDANFNELLGSSYDLSIHLRQLPHDRSVDVCTWAISFTIQKNPYNIPNIRIYFSLEHTHLFGSVNPTAFCSIQF